jgi:lipopolysaccharide transport protein LptA
MIGALALVLGVTAQEKPKATVKPASKTANATAPSGVKNGPAEDEEVVEVEAADMDENVKAGITVLTGNVSIIRETGYLYADKVTLYRDPDSNDKSVQRTVAEGNVRLKDNDLVGTCDHAEFRDGNNMIELVGSEKNPAVVLQEQDRYEAPRFTYDRRTGRRTASGGVKLRVRVKKPESEATPAPATEPKETASSETTTDGK